MSNLIALSITLFGIVDGNAVNTLAAKEKLLYHAKNVKLIYVSIKIIVVSELFTYRYIL